MAAPEDDAQLGDLLDYFTLHVVRVSPINSSPFFSVTVLDASRFKIADLVGDSIEFMRGAARIAQVSCVIVFISFNVLTNAYFPFTGPLCRAI